MIANRLAALGRFCFVRRWIVLGAWVLVLAAGTMSFGPVFASLGRPTDGPAHTESARGWQVLDASATVGAGYVVLVDAIDADDPTTLAAIDGVATSLATVDGVARVVPPVTAIDGRAVAVQVDLTKGLPGSRQDAAEATIKKRLAELREQLPRADVALGGSSLINAQANETVQNDLGTAEKLSLPITLVVLVFVFGGLVAAAVPVLAAIATAVGAFGGLYLFSRFVDLDANAVSVVSILSLALAIDYGLLIVSRYRRELAEDGSRIEAISRTWATAGHTVLFSGAVVAGSLSGLLFFDVPQLRTIGAAGISTALIGVVSAATFTAAILGVLGNRVRPSARRARAGRGFDRVARSTQRRPWLVGLGATLILVTLSAPLWGLRLTLPGLQALPQDLPAVQVATAMTDRFGLSAEPAVTVVARLSAPDLQAWAESRASNSVQVEPAEAVGDRLSMVALEVPGDSQGAQARALVDRLRADRPSAGESWVTGPAAEVIDIQDQILDRLPLAVAVMAGVMLVLLTVLTGSVVLPVKALLMNVLSLGATFGVMVAIFQNGWLHGLLGTITIGGLSPFMMVVVAAFAFGLSMDYELFLLARIKERYDGGDSNDVAVRRGLGDTGRIITSAAALMMVVFAFFGAATVSDLQQIGIGLFVAVLIDATIVRCLLVPATMTVLGRRNWWAPWRAGRPEIARPGRSGLVLAPRADRPEARAEGSSASGSGSTDSAATLDAPPPGRVPPEGGPVVSCGPSSAPTPATPTR